MTNGGTFFGFGLSTGGGASPPPPVEPSWPPTTPPTTPPATPPSTPPSTASSSTSGSLTDSGGSIFGAIRVGLGISVLSILRLGVVCIFPAGGGGGGGAPGVLPGPRNETTTSFCTGMRARMAARPTTKQIRPACTQSETAV